MADPILAAHEIAPSCFDLSGRFQPASIRDQMLRGYLTVERLFESGRLTPHSQILIVGAGAGGVASGIQAARRGATVTIVEQANRPFVLQRDAGSRWIDPTQYDWPSGHWREGKFPWIERPPMPLYWEKGPASEIAVDWAEQLEAEVRLHRPRLLVRYSTRFECLIDIDSALERGSLQAVLADSAGSHVEIFDAAIFCHGFGRETTAIADYIGPLFWNDSCLRAWKDGQSTLVVGGGDGALQDFLLLTTGKRSARDIYDAILPTHLGLEIERETQSAEDQAQRASLWAANRLHDHAIQMWLEQIHRKLADQVLRNESSVRSALNNMVSGSRTHVTIAHRCSHFGRVYAINRFLALLIVRFLEDRNLRPRRSGVVAESIRSGEAAHSCDPSNPEWCYGYPHSVTFRADDCLAASQDCSAATPFDAPAIENFDRIVIRAGVEAPSGIAVRLNPGVEVSLWRWASHRQSLPYHAL